MRTVRDLTVVKIETLIDFYLDFEFFIAVTLPLQGFCSDVAHCTDYAAVRCC
jgi:hypothetical protein